MLPGALWTPCVDPAECSKAASNIVGPTESGEIGRSLHLAANHLRWFALGQRWGIMWAEHWGRTSHSPEEQGEAAGTREWGQDTAAPADTLEPFPLGLTPCPEEMCMC